MDLKITRQKADWNTSKLGSEKLLCVIEFPNAISTKTNKSFKWIPTYKQLEDIKKELDEVEEQWRK